MPEIWQLLLLLSSQLTHMAMLQQVASAMGLLQTLLVGCCLFLCFTQTVMSTTWHSSSVCLDHAVAQPEGSPVLPHQL